MENLHIGDEAFYANLAEYAMIDQKMVLEGRITKVKIEGRFDFKDESTKYMFDIGVAKLQSTGDQLFVNEEEARAYIQTQIDAVPVIVNLQEPIKDITKEVAEADQKGTAFWPAEWKAAA